MSLALHEHFTVADVFAKYTRLAELRCAMCSALDVPPGLIHAPWETVDGVACDLLLIRDSRLAADGVSLDDPRRAAVWAWFEAHSGPPEA